ncbi:AraC-like DNA-binding protein [Kineosphaera limosa]|uniref:Putative transcriptional regulator n=1 Tax=Kineosphaera limosa NBRC 100340 TaxID=1184609 RepID=K6VJU6_9MICO|nr:helix-turn-helix domain-containing protein [Kineosphaera limosa]NYD99142.1 AraC-like DNA-binding protein [Kineosphaera limosa]GAB96498.1 putative transcriptional regulator [Kineosphaera limosa NBRC 100340]
MASTRGILYPNQLPSFSRHAPSPAVGHLVRWFWVSRWDIAPGRISRQELLAFPALNLVVEDSCVGISGPTTTRSHRDLTDRGWGVGALLRPAATPGICPDPARVRDRYELVTEPDLHARVAAPMALDPPEPEQACRAFEAWLLERVPTVTPDDLAANDLVSRIEEDATLRRVEDVAAAMNLSVRTVQRLTQRYVGLTPLTMIRRRRLQEAAVVAREDPDVTLAALAADLGYADQAHLIRDFRDVLGFTPGAYRRSSHGS